MRTFREGPDVRGRRIEILWNDEVIGRAVAIVRAESTTILDVEIDEDRRGQGHGSALIAEVARRWAVDTGHAPEGTPFTIDGGRFTTGKIRARVGDAIGASFLRSSLTALGRPERAPGGDRPSDPHEAGSGAPGPAPGNSGR